MTLSALGSNRIRQFRRAIPYLLLIFIALTYAAYRTQTYYWDGVLFSLFIEGVHKGQLPSTTLFHPNHLVYSALGYVFYSTALNSGLRIRALTVLQMLNIVAGALTGFVLFGVAKRMTSFSVALFCWILFAFGATWWKFSTDANSYIIAVLLLTLTVALVLDDPPRLIPAALCHTLAMLFHELAIFTYFPVIAAILFTAQWSKRKRFWAAAAYVCATGGWAGAAYLACYSRTNRTVYPTLFAWVTSFASDSGFTHSISQITGSYVSSFLKLFAGGKLSLIREYWSIPVFLALAISFGMLIWAVFLFRRARDTANVSANRRAALILWMWLVPCAIFLASWDPGSAFHKLFVWPPVVLLMGTYVGSRSANDYSYAWLALAAALAAWNFGAFIFPHSHASADPVLVLAQTLDRQLPERVTVYYLALDPDDWYLDYFAPGRTWSKLPTTAQLLAARLRSNTLQPVCLETTALDQLETNPAIAAYLHRDIDPNRRWILINSRHHIRVECLKSPP